MPLPPPQRIARRLLQATAIRPDFAIVLGSGFHGIAESVEIDALIPFSRLPGFPTVRVTGHSGTLLAGRLAGRAVFVLCGRAHFYEGHDMATVTFPMRVLAAAGVRRVLLTNAAGGINPQFRPGHFMTVRDHINFMGVNPLRGEEPAAGTRFVDLSETYSSRLRRLLSRAARETRIRLHTGVYLAVSGPSYETPAEIDAFARLGADAVGMSTVPEAIVARQSGLEVAALSCITNLAAGRHRGTLSHADVLEAGRRAQDRAVRLVTRFVELAAELESPPPKPASSARSIAKAQHSTTSSRPA